MTLHEFLRIPDSQAGLSPWGRAAVFTWRYKITAAGRMLLLLLLIAGPVSAAIGPGFPLYYFTIFLFAFMLMGRLAGLLLGPRVRVERALPERCAAGATLQILARVTNPGPLPVFDLAVNERMPHWSVELEKEPRYLECLPVGAARDLAYSLTPTERGVYDFRGPVALTAFPFGVYNHSRSFAAAHRMLVYPHFARLAAIDLPVGRKHQPGGLRLVSHVGDSEEFLGNREYRPGDRLRDIHHSAWARTGYPVVREFQEEYLCRIAMIVDTHAPRGDRRAAQDLEAALSLSAAIADALSRQEYVIDLFAAGPDLYHFQAGRALAYLDSILDILACIEPCRTSPFQVLGPAIAEEIGQISTVIFVFLDWTEDRERFARSIRELGVAAKVIVIRSGETTADPTEWMSEGGPAIVLTPAEVEAGVESL